MYSLGHGIRYLLRSNHRGYTPYIALLLSMGSFFQSERHRPFGEMRAGGDLSYDGGGGGTTAVKRKEKEYGIYRY